MVIMDSFYSQHRLQEIWNDINKYHLIYLEMGESPEKLDHRIKLEDCIKEYLCIASHNQKFFFPQTTEVLQRSASSKKDFSGYKAANGWNTIQMYAGNLLSQPWRKEYRHIKTYSGFYRHQIQANLDGAEVMFEAMGYKHDGNGVLVLDGPICPDTVTHVSRDSLIAYVECQILKMIWEELSSSGIKITWLDVLDFRKSHMCSPDQAIKSLKYRQQQRQYHPEHARSYSHGNDFPGTTQRAQIMPMQNTSPLNHSFPPLTSLHHNIQISPQAYYGNTCCGNNYATYNPVPVQSNYNYVFPPVVKQQAYNTNGYGCSNGYPQMQTSYYLPVPTAQLIELENHNGSGYDVVDKPGHSKYRHATAQETLPPIDLPKNKLREEEKASNKESDKDDSQFEDWAYVYRNLQSQGYSKDLGERGDLLSPPIIDKRRISKDYKKVETSNLDELMHNFSVHEKPLKVTEALEIYEKENKAHLETKHERKSSKGSSYENMFETVIPEPIKKMVDVKPVANISKTKTLPKDKVTKELLPSKSIHSKTLDIKKINEEKKQIENDKITTNSWHCKACTFLNEKTKDICEMCSKTRKNSICEPTMEIGGSECKKCTLVNPKDTKICQACSASLKDSATYI